MAWLALPPFFYGSVSQPAALPIDSHYLHYISRIFVLGAELHLEH